MNDIWLDRDEKYSGRNGKQVQRQLRDLLMAYELSGMAFRDNNAVSTLINRGYMTHMPIDPKLFWISNELLGTPHELIKAKTKRQKSPSPKIYGTLEDGDLALELDVMTWFAHAFLLSVAYPTSYTMGVYLGRHGMGEQYKDRETLARAYKKISAFVTSFDWKVKLIVFDGERAMGTDEFLMTVWDTGARLFLFRRDVKLKESKESKGMLRLKLGY